MCTHRNLRWITFGCLLGSATSVIRDARAQEPIVCEGVQVGTLQFFARSGAGQPSLHGNFLSTIDSNQDGRASLDEAAAQCGQDHFNFFQIVRSDTSPLSDANGVRLVPPHLDTPPGGYHRLWDDRLPWYMTEGPLPPAATIGFDPLLHIQNRRMDANNDGIADTLTFEDAPSSGDGTVVNFELWLASVNRDGSLHGFHEGGITWTWENPVTAGVDELDPSDWTVTIDQSLVGLPDPVEVEILISNFSEKMEHGHVATVQAAGQRAIPQFAESLVDAGTAPANFHSFYLPHLTSNGQLMYPARITTGTLDEAPFETSDSIWTAKVAPTPYSEAPAVTQPRAQVTHGDIAPVDGWRAGGPPANISQPRFIGQGAARIVATGIDQNQRIVFQANRGGKRADTETLHAQSDAGIVWSAQGGQTQLSLFAGPDEVIDIELLSEGGQEVVVVPGEAGQRLLVPGVGFVDQNAVPGTLGFRFTDGFGIDGNYAYSDDARTLVYLSAIEAADGDPDRGFRGIYRLDPIQSTQVATEGEMAQLDENTQGQIIELQTGFGNAYRPQVTPDGGAAFLADFMVEGTRQSGVFLGSGDSPAQALVRSGVITEINVGGESKDARLSLFDDVLVGEDGTIYFEAEAEIRELPLPFETRNIIWSMRVGEAPRALFGLGDVPETLEGDSLELELSGSFRLIDVNRHGHLVVASQLERQGLVNRGNDDVLLAFDPDSPALGRPALIVVARQGDLIPGSETDRYAAPSALRERAISDSGHIAFASGDERIMLARLLTERQPGDLNADGSVDVDDIITLVAQPLPQPGSNGRDLTFDGVVDAADLEKLVIEELNTSFGDANLDGEFNSGDLVQVFAKGLYEDGIEDNSDWTSGDWNGDLDFDSSDLVKAFQGGSYEQGRRDVRTAVPEPANRLPLVTGLMIVALSVRTRTCPARGQRARRFTKCCADVSSHGAS